MEKKLYRSRDGKLICGVCAGIAEYFDIDPTVVRVAWACFTVFSTMFPGVILYFILALIMPANR